MSKITTLAQICDVLSDGLHKAPIFNPTGEYLFVNATNLENGYIVDKGEGKRADFFEYQKYGIELNDRTILYSIDGTIGNIAKYRGEKVILGKGACYLMVKGDVDPDYIYFLLQSEAFNGYIRKMSTGSTIHHISLETMRNFKFSLPDYDTQKSISSALMALENKIHHNARLAAELESMAKTIYDYWFTQFDFPNADGKPYRSSGGTMEWNELFKREIPKGWIVAPLSQFLNCNKHTVRKKDQLESICYLDTGSLTDNAIDTVEYFESISVAPVRAQRIVHQNDILYSTVRPIQRHYGIIKHPAKNMVASSGFACLSSKSDPKYNDLFYLFITAPHNTKKLCAIADSSVSAYPSINPSDILDLQIALPKHLDEIDELVSSLSNLLYAKAHWQDEIRQLLSLRDWLLPMLMNGQATVADAEEKVSKVVPFAPQTVEVRQAARNFGDKKTDDTADLVKAFMRRKQHDSKA